MSDKMMRIAGRTTEGTAKAILTNNEGSIIVDREWTIENTIIYNAEINDANWHTITTILDLSIYPINSLRILNTTSQAITIRFLNDVNNNDNEYLSINDSTVDIVLSSSNTNMQVFTPQEMPILNYIKYLNLQIKAESAPTTGSLIIYHCGRK